MVNLIPGIASLFIGGLGQILKGEVSKGVKILVTFAGLGVLNLFVLFNFPQFGIVTNAALGIFFLAQVLDAVELIDLGEFIPFYS